MKVRWSTALRCTSSTCITAGTASSGEHGRDSFVRRAHGKMKWHHSEINYLHVVSFVPGSADG